MVFENKIIYSVAVGWRPLNLDISILIGNVLMKVHVYLHILHSQIILTQIEIIVSV
jgi:hypothetical protein